MNKADRAALVAEIQQFFNEIIGPVGALKHHLLLARAMMALKADNVDAERWRALVNLWCASTELRLAQDEDGAWSVAQVEPVENETFAPLRGETPDATIDLARK